MASSAQAPTLVKDINPAGGSNIAFLTCVGDLVYFRATDNVHGAELWRTDGTEAGTMLVKDIDPGPVSGVPSNFMVFNGMLHFITGNATTGRRLWRSDGTEAGTQMLLSLEDLPGLNDWNEFAVMGDRIFFRGTDTANDPKLWSTDGTPAGTQLVAGTGPGNTFNTLQDIMSYEGNLYFKAFDPVHGEEPWTSDGTEAGTRMLAETYPGPASPGPWPPFFTGAGGLVFFRAPTVNSSDELWVTDGTEPGTHLVRDIYPGPNSSVPSNLIEHNGQLLLRVYPSTNSDGEIWQSDGTEAGTGPWADLGYTHPDNLCSHNGAVYMAARGASGQKQLWRTDNTAAGTYEILLPGSDLTQPLGNTNGILSCNGMLFYRASYQAAIGEELYALGQPTGVEEHVRGGMRIHPNPATDRVWVVPEGAPSGPATLIVRDLLGRAIASQEAVAPDGSGRYHVDLEGIAPGPYLLELYMGGTRWSNRFLKG